MDKNGVQQKLPDNAPNVALRVAETFCELKIRIMNESIERLLYIDEEHEKVIWDKCIVVFDTSALLSLYDYTEIFREKFYLEVLEKFKGRLFITGHSEFEFFKNRNNKIENPIRQKITPFRKSFLKKIDASISDIEKELLTIKNDSKRDDRVPFFMPDIFQNVEESIAQLKAVVGAFGVEANSRLDSQVAEILKLKEEDSLYHKLSELFQVGNQYSFSEIINLIKEEGEFRHKNLIPPGFMDNPLVNNKSDKSGIQIYGDLIIWKQVMELAIQNKSNVLFVTNDLKVDWCETDEKNKTRIKRPVVDLVKEFNDVTSYQFWMYSLSDILYFSNKYLDAEFSEEEIKIADQLTVSEELDLKIYSSEKCVIECLHCHNVNEYRPDDLMIDFEAIGGGERGMGEEVHFQSESYLSCLACDNSIDLELNIWEYPVGAHNYNNEEIDRGEIITMYDYVTDFGKVEEKMNSQNNSYLTMLPASALQVAGTFSTMLGPVEKGSDDQKYKKGDVSARLIKIIDDLLRWGLESTEIALISTSS